MISYFDGSLFLVFWYHSSKSTEQMLREKISQRALVVILGKISKNLEAIFANANGLAKLSLSTCPTYAFVICFFTCLKSRITASIDQLELHIPLHKSDTALLPLSTRTEWISLCWSFSIIWQIARKAAACSYYRNWKIT